jgi:hypothetical protein
MACSHTPAEHERMKADVQEAIEGGDLSPLLPSLGSQNLIKLVQAGILELLVRTETHDEAKHIWNQLDSQIRSGVLVDSAQESADPDLYQGLQQQREIFKELVASQGGQIPEASTPSKPRYGDPGGDSDGLYL